ncbi:hypothetical protein VXQ18_14755 [Brucella abortus]|nr:hypothetical protein [Brucella abortus]
MLVLHIEGAAKQATLERRLQATMSGNARAGCLSIMPAHRSSLLGKLNSIEARLAQVDTHVHRDGT